jgi:hypothetical protein
MSPDHGLGLIYQLRGSRTAVPDVASDVAAAATRANATVGSGRGPVHGSRVHTAFRQEILALGRSDVFSEISYLNGRVVPYGTPGSVRLDAVVDPNLTAPVAVYDLKTGSAHLTQARINQIRSHLPPAYMNVPILKLR